MRLPRILFGNLIILSVKTKVCVEVAKDTPKLAKGS